MCKIVRRSRNGLFPTVIQQFAILTIGTILAGCGGGGNSNGSGEDIVVPETLYAFLSPSRIMAGSDVDTIMIRGRDLPVGPYVEIDEEWTGSNFINSTAISVILQHAIDINVPANHEVVLRDFDGKIVKTLNLEIYAPRRGPFPLTAVQAYPADDSHASDSLHAVVVADLQGDGSGDVVAAGERLHIFRGRPDGTLDPDEIVDIGGCFALASGDINGDGFDDIAAASSVGSVPAAVILANDGAGSLRRSSTLILEGIDSKAILLEDMNADGRKDLLMSVRNPHAIFMALSQGESFGSATKIAYPPYEAESLSVADLNGDGLKDIVYSYTNRSTSRTEVRLLLQQPGGAFTDKLTSLMMPDALKGNASIIDYDKDDAPDLVVQALTSGLQPRITFDVYKNLGDASFSPVSTLVMDFEYYPNQIYRMVAGDFDYDGHPDLAGVGGSPYDLSHVLYLWGDGAGSFTLEKFLGASQYNLATGDVNADGIPDLVSIDYDSYVYLLPGKTGRSELPPVALYGDHAGELSTADVKGDGYPDLLETEWINLLGKIYLNDGFGGFSLASASVPVEGKVIEDLDGDGKMDLVGENDSAILIWPGDGSGQFPATPIELPVAASIEMLQVLDMDNDGKVDIIASNRDGDGIIFFSEGAFSYTSQTFRFQIPYLLGDFNGDGFPDIAGSEKTLLGRGSRLFEEVVNNLGVLDYSIHLASADFNRDGVLDAAYGGNNYIAVAMGNGDGTFTVQDILSCEFYPYGIAASDINGDGLVDIVAGGSHVALFTNDGRGGFLRSFMAAGTGSSQVVPSDFNGDLKPDLALHGLEIVILFGSSR